MNITFSKFSRLEFHSLLKLAIPLVLNGFLEASVGFSSTYFLAQLGALELAAGALAQWVFFTMMVILWGTLCSVSVVVAQKYGQKNETAIAQVLRDGLILALLMSLPTVLLLRNIGPILLLAGQEPSTVHLAVSYMRALSWGMAPDFIMLVLGQFLIGMGHTRTTLFFTLLWVPLNIVSNYAFMFGKFGLPTLGMAGIGWGTSFAFTVMAVVLFSYLYANKKYRPYIAQAFRWTKPSFLIELCQVGIPMGSMYCIEVGFFMTLTLIMGHWGASILAANQITLQFSGLFSVATFSIAQAVTVRMGHTLGANQPNQAERSAYIGMGMALAFMSLVALGWWIVPEMFIGFDLNLSDPRNADIIHYAKQFLAIGAFFQLIETIRFVLFGALRGLKDTRFTLLVDFFTARLFFRDGFAIKWRWFMVRCGIRTSVCRAVIICTISL
jgi:MATE family multidrug resistance protein